MKKFPLGWCLGALAALAAVWGAAGLAAAEDALSVVPGFEVCSYYLRLPENTASLAAVRLGPDGRETAALPPVWLPGEKIFAGTLVNLRPDSEYTLRVKAAGGRVWKQVFRTRGAPELVAESVALDGGRVKIDRSGTPGGYIRYYGVPGKTVEGGIALQNLRYVILENLTIVGGARDALSFKNCENIRIYNCDISGYGRVGGQRPERDGKYYGEDNRPLNYDSGIRVEDCSDVVLERNYIHDPRGFTNGWFHSHPAGPNAILVGGTRRCALRYNNCVGSEVHRWNDAVEGLRNGQPDGGICRDGEVCGNLLVLSNDDGMELDGGQVNMRFFRNWAEANFCCVSTAPCLTGPSFIFDNFFGRQGDAHGSSGAAVKNIFSSPEVALGRLHLVGNTIVGGGSVSGYAGDENQVRSWGKLLKMVARNNVVAAGGGIFGRGLWAQGADLDGDLLYSRTRNAVLAELQQMGQETHGVQAEPEFADAEKGDFSLRASTPGGGAARVYGDFCPAAGRDCGAFADKTANACRRPTGMNFTTLRLHFDAEDTARAPAPQEIGISTDGEKPLHFTVKINAADAFLKVTPAEGIVKKGSPVTLTVNCDKDRLPFAANLRAFMLVALDDGMAQPVAVSVAAAHNKKLLARDRKDVVFGTVKYEKGVASGEFAVNKLGAYYVFLKTSSGHLGAHRLAVNGGEMQTVRRGHRGEGGKHPWICSQGDVYVKGGKNQPFIFSKGRVTVKITPKEGRLPMVTRMALAPRPECLLRSDVE